MQIDRIHGENGYNKACKHCSQFFWTENANKKYCNDKCRRKAQYRRFKRKAFFQNLLRKFGLGTVSKENKQDKKSPKPDYSRLTFVLSVLSFLGSLGFYFGVLRQVYSPTSDKQKIEQLQSENRELQKAITVLIEKGEESDRD